MSDGPILICYAGTEEDRHAIDAAGALLGGRRAVVLNVAPAMTPAESFAAATSVVPGNAFEGLNTAGSLEHARGGAELAVRAGFEADARGDTAPSTWEGIVEVADEIDAAVIVIGSRRLVPIRRLFERSVSHDVSEHARRPVLIVPPST
jgi:nucleotide-binding universal stress UspA family protein